MAAGSGPYVTGSRSGPQTNRVEDVIVERVAERAAQWFPDVGSSPTVHLRTLSSRPRCSLYAARLTGHGTTRQVLAKVRRDGFDGTTNPDGQRPRLRPEPSTVAQLTMLEYEGLQSIAAFVGSSHPDFGAIRPLDHLESASTIFMDYVEARTLRQVCIAQSRLTIPRGASRQQGQQVSARSWRNAGAWLRAYHDAPANAAVASRSPRQATREDVVDRFAAFGDFLTDRLGAPVVGDVATRGAWLAADLLPARLPLVIGHGDYVMRNMFVDAHGRITVFDPLPRWRMPFLEDLCRFLVGLRLLGLQVHSHGVAYGRRELDRLELLFLSGYFAGDDLPLRQIRCYQLLITLDKWSALVDCPTAERGWRSRLRSAVMFPANGYIQREARRLLDLTEGSPSSALSR